MLLKRNFIFFPILFATILTSWSLVNKRDSPNSSELNQKKIEKKITEQKTVSISCDKDNSSFSFKLPSL